MISDFLSNISVIHYRNRIVHVKILASQRWDVFRHGVGVGYDFFAVKAQQNYLNRLRICRFIATN